MVFWYFEFQVNIAFVFPILGHPWSTTAKYLLDALIYSLVIAGSFAWLWPA